MLEHLDTPEGRARDLSCVAIADAATSATPIELLTAIDRALPNAKVRVFYGSTEAGSGLVAAARRHVPQARERRRARGPHRDPRRSTDGELWVRGPLLFDGYLDDPEATAAALEDGWYRTGDVVDVDDEGYLSIVGPGARRDPHRWRDGRAAGGRVGARAVPRASPTSR